MAAEVLVVVLVAAEGEAAKFGQWDTEANHKVTHCIFLVLQAIHLGHATRHMLIRKWRTAFHLCYAERFTPKLKAFP